MLSAQTCFEKAFKKIQKVMKIELHIQSAEKNIKLSLKIKGKKLTK